MIESLHISNYALIENVDIEFGAGLNIITGETGAGKSIILGALSLLLGGRADTRVVRNPDRKSVIEAQFSVAGRSDIKQYCEENDLECGDDNCILRREISPNGRSRAFINDTPVNLDQLKGLALKLVDIHSQHQNLLLASPPYQLQILDVLAENGSRLEEYEKRYAVYRKALKEYALFKREIEKSADDADFLRYQLDKIDKLKLQPSEQEELERERELLANVTEVKTSLQNVLSALSEASPSVLSLLKDAVDGVAELSDVIDDADSFVGRLEAVLIEVQDIAETFEGYDNNLNADPDMLEHTETRLNEIYELERRHSVDSSDELIRIADELRSKLNMVDNSDELLKDLEHKARQTKVSALELARQISESRKSQSEVFAELLRQRALPLGMKNLNVKIAVEKTDMSVTGIDAVEFLFAFNKNQEPLSVGKTASGGEISRLMLSIKSIVADRMQLPSIIFDEVDTGVSGEIADRMGDLMKQISKNIQVIAITHLPQVAAKGDHHFKVFKLDSETSTNTCITRLSSDDRVAEIAAMLSGSTVDEHALAAAQSLIDNNK